MLSACARRLNPLDNRIMRKTELYDEHVDLGGKMIEFAGYQMPIQYPEGIMKEHNWVRESAGLFDVSHMGQAILEGANAIEFLEEITPSSFSGTPNKKSKYTVFLNENGGIVDDLIVTKLADDKFFLVYNAGCKQKDETFVRKKLAESLTFRPLMDRALIALQGAASEIVLDKVLNLGEKGGFGSQEYMTLQEVQFEGGDLFVSRLGYTGEDGFEISIDGGSAAKLWKAILAHEEVKPIGLGARDSLRLEMGYPLYGHDLDDETNPMEAGLGWVVAKANKIKYENPKRRRVGVELIGKGIIRERVKIFAIDGSEIGVITSGGFSPTLQKTIAQGYVRTEFSALGTKVNVELRGKLLEAKICSYAFVKPRTKQG